MPHPIEDDILERAQAILGHRFARLGLLAEALTHASSASDRLRSNERMEFLGDAILGAVVCEYLYHQFPDDLEGEMTKIKSAVVSRRTCAQVSDLLGLTDLLQLGKGMSGRKVLPSSLAAAVYESVVAAIYIDGGLEPARDFILRHMVPIIEETAESAHQHNFKSLLQQHAQRSMEELPAYRLLDEKGPDHSKCFEVCVEINGRRFTSAWAPNKKQAEQQAALNALHELNVVRHHDDGRVLINQVDAEGSTTGEDAGSNAV